MKLIPGSKFVYKQTAKTPAVLGAHTWAPSKRIDDKGLLSNETYVVYSIRPQREGHIIYTLVDTQGNTTEQTFSSANEAEEAFGV